MKTLKCLFAFAFILLTLPLAANDDPILKVRSEVDGKALIVQITNLQQQPAKMVLESLDGEETFFTKTIRNHNGYRSKIDLEKLPRGRYIFKVVQDGKAYKQVVLIRENSVKLSSVFS